ncbi:MAG: F0F1 ATP synthase subunit A [Acholeplasmataceae bacterium]
MDTIMNYITSLPGYFVTSLGIMLGMAIVLFIAGKRVEQLNPRSKPSKVMTVFVGFVKFFNQFMKGYVGKQAVWLTPMVMTLAIYVFISNVSGMFALDSPTKYTSITFSLSIFAFLIIQITGIISSKWKHFLSVFQPIPFLMPLNVIGEVTPIISIALRLFGNIISGAVFIVMIYRFTGWFSVVVAPAFHLIFDVGFGLIQALVYVLLTVIFTSSKIDEKDFI